MALITPSLSFFDFDISTTRLLPLDKESTESIVKNSNISILPFTLKDDENTEIFGTTGATSIITVQGNFIGPLDPAEPNSLSALADNALDFVRANPQQSQVWTYTSNLFPTGITVAVISLNLNLTNLVQSKLGFTLKMAIGTPKGVAGP